MQFSSDEKLIIFDRGDKPFYFFGMKIDELPRNMANPPQLVLAHDNIFFQKHHTAEILSRELGPNGKRHWTIDVYLMDENKETKFVAKFGQTAAIVDGVITVNTQIYGLVQEDW